MIDQQCRILLVEESPTQFRQLSDRLKQEGWDVTWARNVHDALRALTENAPDLILVDYHLPDLDGGEFCRQVRMRIDTRVIPIIIQAIGDDFDIETIGLESGADDFIRKSADTEYLLIRIKTLLGRAHRYPSILAPAKLDAADTHLLAIDDSSTYRTYLTQQLAMEAYQLETVASGAEGLERLAAEDFGCVIVDWMMPGMDGIEVCERIDELRRRGIRQPMILMLTAKKDREGMERALEAGADDFVGKSADIVVVKVRIRALLRRKFYEEENRRILEELKHREMEVERAQLERNAAEARAALVDELERKNVELTTIKSELEDTVASLDYSNKQLEEFAFVASHHLQEPTRQLILLSEMICEDMGEGLSTTVEDDLQKMCDKASRMRNLVHAIRELSRVAQPAAKPEPVSLDACADEAIKSLARRIEQTRGEIGHGELPQVVGYASLLTQLYRHLIINALVFAAPGKHPVIRFTAKHADGNWILGVRDNGIGIATESAEKIFAPFKRLHRDDEYEGIGVGLTHCRKIIDRHGGRIWVESQPGQGATFYFTIPDTGLRRETKPQVEPAHAMS